MEVERDTKAKSSKHLIVEIPGYPEYRLVTDKYNWQLVRKRVGKKGVSWANEGYYPSLVQAIRGMFDKLPLTKTGVVGIVELLTELIERQKEFSAIVPKVSSEILKSTKILREEIARFEENNGSLDEFDGGIAAGSVSVLSSNGEGKGLLVQVANIKS